MRSLDFAKPAALATEFRILNSDLPFPRRLPKSYLIEIWLRHLPFALESPVSVGPENVMQKQLMAQPWELFIPFVI